MENDNNNGENIVWIRPKHLVRFTDLGEIQLNATLSRMVSFIALLEIFGKKIN